MGITIFWAIYFYLEMASWYLDYDLRWVGKIRRLDVAMGRVITVALFFAK